MGIIPPRARVRASAPRRALLLGDSIFEASLVTSSGVRSYPEGGFWTHMQRIMGQPFTVDPALNKAVGGNNTGQIEARYAADVAANFAKFDIGFEMSGTNDVVQRAVAGDTAKQIVDAVVARRQAFATRALAAGKWWAMFSILPRSVWGGASAPQIVIARRALLGINAALREWARGIDGLVFVDCYRDLVDPASADSNPLAGLLYDNLHPGLPGARLIGRRAAAVLGPLMPAAAPFGFGAGDAFEATTGLGNLLANPSCLTATGGALTNVGGTLPASWTGTRSSGSFLTSEVVLSTEAGVAGFGATPGNKIVATVNIAADKPANEIQTLSFGQWVTAAGKWVSGDRLVAECEVELSGLVGLVQASLILFDNDGVTNRQWYDGSSTGGKLSGDPGKLFFRTPVVTVAPYAGSGTQQARLGLLFSFDATGATATGLIKVGEPQLRKLP